jgi:chromatin assembly factor 1 subunit A
MQDTQDQTQCQHIQHQPTRAAQPTKKRQQTLEEASLPAPVSIGTNELPNTPHARHQSEESELTEAGATTPSRGEGSSSIVPPESLKSTSSSNMPLNAMTAALKHSIQPTGQPPAKKPKLTFTEKEEKRIEKEIRDREKAEERVRKEAEKAAKDAEKARKEAEKKPKMQRRHARKPRRKPKMQRRRPRRNVRRRRRNRMRRRGGRRNRNNLSS